MQAVAQEPLDLIISDYRMPGLTGLEFLGLLRERGLPDSRDHHDRLLEHRARGRVDQGRRDRLHHQARSAETLELAVHQALEVVRLRRENETFRREVMELRSTGAHRRQPAVPPGDGDDRARPRRRAPRCCSRARPAPARSCSPARSTTRATGATAPFITLNCAAMPEGLVESALFGHEKGAFTGATVRTDGAFERAHRGTLLLDEICEMRLDLQAKLLRVLQEQEFERVGGTQPIKVDVRIVATTNRDLKTEVDAGRFRSDLYLSAERGARSDAPAARAAGGHSAARPALHPARRRRHLAHRNAFDRAGNGASFCRGYAVAGERAGAGQRHRARGDSLPGPVLLPTASRASGRSGHGRARRTVGADTGTESPALIDLDRDRAAGDRTSARRHGRATEPRRRNSWASASARCGTSSTPLGPKS